MSKKTNNHEEEYGVVYIQVKENDFEKIYQQAITVDYKKVYIQVCPNESLMVQASLIDKDLMDAIDIWRGKGYDPQLNTGKPDDGCPVTGC